MMNLIKREEIMAKVNEVPAWLQFGSVLFFMLYMALQMAIQYTYGHVVATLAMVEDPETTAIVRTVTSNEEPDATLPPYSDDAKIDVKEPLLDNIVQQEVLLIKSRPITASLKTTIRHLRERAGFFSRFRGAGVLVLYCSLCHLFTRFWNSAFGGPVLRVVGFVIAQVGLARLGMLWTHIVISEPSEKKWYQRLANRETTKKITIPTLAAALVQIALPAVPVAVFFMVDAQKYLNGPLTELTTSQRVALAFKLLTVLASGIAYFVMVFIPITIGLVRCQAALLSEEETPIVPFDRTFGGKFVPVSEGGSGKLLLKDAWKSYDWNGRVRLIKVWTKMIAMQAALTVGFVAVAVATFAAVYDSKAN